MRRRKLLIKLIITSLLFLLPICSLTQPLKDTLRIKGSGKYPITRHLWIFRTSRNFTITQLRHLQVYQHFKPFGEQEALNEIFEGVPYYWLSWTVKNERSSDESFYFWFNSPGLPKLEAFRVSGYGKNENDVRYEGSTGFYVPFHQRQNRSYDAEFKFALRKGETAIFFIRIENDGENAFFAPEFSDSATYKSRHERYILIMGLISGIMIAAFIFNIFLGIAIEEKLHYLYAAYILFVLFEILILEGILTSYLSLYFNNELIALFAMLNPLITTILMTFVMQWFLNQKCNNSPLKVLVDIGVYLLTLLIAIHILNYFFRSGNLLSRNLQTLMVILVGSQVLLIVFSAAHKAFHGSKSAKVYLLASLFPFTGIIEIVLVYTGYGTVSGIRQTHPNHFQLGLVIETIIVFLAIIRRYNLYKIEKEKLLAKVNEQQRDLIDKIVSAEEAERKRIAQDLHDDVASTLTALNLHISNLPVGIPASDELATYYNKGIFLSNKAVSDIRDIAHNLLPRDYKAIGLFKSLQNSIEEFSRVSNIRFSLILNGDDLKLKEEFSMVVYRVVNELTTNIIKHSNALEASIQIFIEEKEMLIMIEDDGVGFEYTEHLAGMGLKNAVSRINILNGSLQIDGIGNGATIIIQLPLHA